MTLIDIEKKPLFLFFFGGKVTGAHNPFTYIYDSGHVLFDRFNLQMNVKVI